MHFWEFETWGFVNIFAVLLISLILANTIKRKVGFLRRSLVPTSVIGGFILLLVSGIYQLITGNSIFNTAFFGGKGTDVLEMITYHCLALGFIASTLKQAPKEKSRERNVEIFNTGVTTVSTYLLQGILGLGITMIIAIFATDIFPAAGILLPFGYGQGTGQALNYGTKYESQGFIGGGNFGLTIAAFGFLSASIGGVFHLSVLNRKKFKLKRRENEGAIRMEEIQKDNEIPMNGSIDKLTVQLAFIALSYLLAYLVMLGITTLLPSVKELIYGFNFLIGVLMASLVKLGIKLCKKTKFMNREYLNNFLLTRTSNFFFDIMIVAGVAAIRIEMLKNQIWVLLLLGIVGLVSTYIYNYFVAKKLFPKYAEEQFLAMYGMLTGTASTGMVLLREIDGNYETPVASNLVYQNFPAMVFGFPMMLLADLAPTKPGLTLIILVGFFAFMNILLFRSFIFKRRKPLAITADGSTCEVEEESDVSLTEESENK